VLSNPHALGGLKSGLNSIRIGDYIDLCGFGMWVAVIKTWKGGGLEPCRAP
jgi:hypothetical protein